jgi:hypothetical protein
MYVTPCIRFWVNQFNLGVQLIKYHGHILLLTLDTNFIKTQVNGRAPSIAGVYLDPRISIVALFQQKYNDVIDLQMEFKMPQGKGVGCKDIQSHILRRIYSIGVDNGKRSA